MPSKTEDSLIEFEPLDPASWLIEQVSGLANGPTRTTMVRCKCTDADQFFFMIAKDYTVGDADILTADMVLQQSIIPSYERMFEGVRVDFIQTTTIHDVIWHEAAIQMKHPTLGFLAKLERVHCIGNHVLILSLEGTQESVQKYFVIGNTWLGNIRFASLMVNY
jgi:hypothetical protein